MKPIAKHFGLSRSARYLFAMIDNRKHSEKA